MLPPSLPLLPVTIQQSAKAHHWQNRNQVSVVHRVHVFLLRAVLDDSYLLVIQSNPNCRCRNWRTSVSTSSRLDWPECRGCSSVYSIFCVIHCGFKQYFIGFDLPTSILGATTNQSPSGSASNKSKLGRGSIKRKRSKDTVIPRRHRSGYIWVWTSIIHSWVCR